MRRTPSLHDITAVVVSAGRMMNAAKVRTTKQIYNSRIQKARSLSPPSNPSLFPPQDLTTTTNAPPLLQQFTISRHQLVSDPTAALRTGDTIRMTTERHSRLIRHVVTAIVAPAAGEPIDERPAVLTGEQREEKRAGKRERKMARREARREGEKGEGAGEADGGAGGKSGWEDRRGGEGAGGGGGEEVGGDEGVGRRIGGRE
ncbi:hypothetical protein MMC15_008234 [Xylographa vitiligo]|nr:hypothetical protein [Xylographa vitiligo]